MYANELICICRLLSVLAIRINANDVDMCKDTWIRAVFLIHGILSMGLYCCYFPAPGVIDHALNQLKDSTIGQSYLSLAAL